MGLQRGKAVKPLCSSGIGAHNHAPFRVEVLFDPTQGTWLRIEIVHGDIEEALDLAGVEIHGDDVVASCRLQHVGH